MANRIDGRWINYFGAEITEFGCLHITQFVDGISSRNNPWISSHKAIHISPYLQAGSIEGCSNHSRRIIRAATTKIRNVSCQLIRWNESRHQRYFRNLPECLFHPPVGQFRVESMFGMFPFRLYKSTRIKPLSSFNQLSHNNGRQPFTIAHNGIWWFRGKVFNQINSLENVFQLIK